MLPGPGARRLTLGIIPEGGAHIDVPRKTVGAWQTADTMGIFQALPDVWGGWRTECWEDRFEEQLIRCNGALRLPELDLAGAWTAPGSGSVTGYFSASRTARQAKF